MAASTEGLIANLNFIRIILIAFISLSFTIYGGLIAAYFRFKKNTNERVDKIEAAVTTPNTGIEHRLTVVETQCRERHYKGKK